MANCRLDALPLFEPGNRIDKLNLCSNMIQILKRSEFFKMKSLQILDLSLNAIHKIDADLFNNFDKLIHYPVIFSLVINYAFWVLIVL
jgi:hypothetical protein